MFQDYRLYRQRWVDMNRVPPPTPRYLFSWQTEEKIKTNIIPDEASCDKQIVGILQPLRHLTQSTVVTFKIKYKHNLNGGSGVKFDWQTEERGR